MTPEFQRAWIEAVAAALRARVRAGADAGELSQATLARRQARLLQAQRGGEAAPRYTSPAIRAGIRARWERNARKPVTHGSPVAGYETGRLADTIRPRLESADLVVDSRRRRQARDIQRRGGFRVDRAAAAPSVRETLGREALEVWRKLWGGDWGDPDGEGGD